MIKTTKKGVVIQGNATSILADYTMITKALSVALEKALDKEIAISLLEKSFHLGLKSEEEVKKEALELIKNKLEEEVACES